MTDSKPDQNQPALPFDQHKWAYEQNIQFAHRVHDTNNDFHKYVNQATIDTSNLAMRTLILINGGAAIAVLTFLGAVASKDKIDLTQVTHVATTIRWFAFGVASAILSMGTSYATHYATAGAAISMKKSYEHPFVNNGPTTKRWMAVRTIFHVASVGLALASLSLFLTGMFKASSAVANLVVH